MNTLLDLPSAKAAAAATRIPANPSQRILVVEDDLAVRQLNAQVLLRSGYEVDAAEDGAAGWEALHANHFDLLITDHDMPRLSGLELVKKVRCARMTLPVILASGSLHTEELERHPWLQLAATLLKPFAPHQLLETVKEVLRAADRASFGPEGCGTVLVNTFRHRLPYQHWDTKG
ncbi:MAG: response regulator [Verrucomicrobia bacterium]|nr:response regulator [Verrucomicrobiota bacterium]